MFIFTGISISFDELNKNTEREKISIKKEQLTLQPIAEYWTEIELREESELAGPAIHLEATIENKKEYDFYNYINNNIIDETSKLNSINKYDFSSSVKRENQYDPIDSISDISKPITDGVLPNNLGHKEDVTPSYENKNHSKPINSVKALPNNLLLKEAVTLLDVYKNENECESTDGITDMSKPIDGVSGNNFTHKEDVTSVHENKNHSEQFDDKDKGAFTFAIKSEEKCKSFKSIYNTSQYIRGPFTDNNLICKKDKTPSHETKNYSVPIDYAKEALTSETTEENESEHIDGSSDISQSISHKESLNNLVHKEGVTPSYQSTNHSESTDYLTGTFTSDIKGKETEYKSTEGSSEISNSISQVESSNNLVHQKDVNPVQKNVNHAMLTDYVEEAFTSALKSGNECEPLDILSDISLPIAHTELRNNVVHKVDESPSYQSKNHSELTDYQKEAFASEIKDENECEPMDGLADTFKSITNKTLVHKEDVAPTHESKNDFEPTDYVKEVLTFEIKNGKECEPVDNMPKISEPISVGESRNNLLYERDVASAYKSKNHSERIDYIKESLTSQTKEENESEAVHDMSKISKSISLEKSHNNLLHKEHVTPSHQSKNHSESTDYLRGAFISDTKGKEAEYKPTNGSSDISKHIPHEEYRNKFLQYDDVASAYESKNQSEPIDYVKESLSSETKEESECKPINGLTDISKLISQGELLNNLVHKADETILQENKNHTEPTDDVKEAYISALKSENECEPIDIISDISQSVTRGGLHNNLFHKAEVTTVQENKNHTVRTDDVKKAFTSEAKNKNECEPIDSISDVSKSITHEALNYNLVGKENLTPVSENKNISETTDYVKGAIISYIKDEIEYQSVDDICDISKIVIDGETRNNLVLQKDKPFLHEYKSHSEPLNNVKEIFTSAKKTEIKCKSNNLGHIKYVTTTYKSNNHSEPIDVIKQDFTFDEIFFATNILNCKTVGTSAINLVEDEDPPTIYERKTESEHTINFPGVKGYGKSTRNLYLTEETVANNMEISTTTNDDDDRRIIKNEKDIEFYVDVNRKRAVGSEAVVTVQKQGVYGTTLKTQMTGIS